MSNNPSGRRVHTPDPDRPEILRNNPNQPENDLGGAVGGPNVRLRDENSLSFRHFLQPQSDLVPQPAPTRNRGQRVPGGVDLVEATMALPDFVQDHLVLESLGGGGGVIEPSQDMSPSRPQPHPHSGGHALDLNHDLALLPDLGSGSSASSQRTHPRTHSSTHSLGRSSRGVDRDRDRDLNDLSPSPLHQPDGASGGSALPDFLSDGPMQLNHGGGSDNSAADFLNSTSTAPGGGGIGGGRGRSSAPNNNHIFPEECPVRGPSFESKESLRLQIDRLRSELAEKTRKIHQLETDLSSQRNVTSNLEGSLRVAERNLAGAEKRATEAEAQLQNPSHHSHSPININGHGGLSPDPSEASLDTGTIASIARSSETLIGHLLHNMQELKKLSEDQGKPSSSSSNSSQGQGQGQDKNKNASSSEDAVKRKSSR